MFKKVVLLTIISVLSLPLAIRAADEKSSKSSSAKSAAADSGNAKADSSKADDAKLKGRLPNYYSKVGLAEVQRQKIYGLQASYASQIEELQKKLTELEAKRDADVRAVLTADQQKKLDELTGDASKAKAAKKEAKSAATTDAKSGSSGAKADPASSAATSKGASK